MVQSAQTVAAVSFLNARPLIDGLERVPEVSLITDVPSRLLHNLTAARARVALCPIIDFQTAATELCIVPAGAIGSDGATHTVRLFSRAPIEDLDCIHTDGDSHTSVALLEVVFEATYGRRPSLVTLSPHASNADDLPEAVLLIGDKVVRNEPRSSHYPYQLDLGAAWKHMTGLPFVFATWLARAGDDLGALPKLLRRTLDDNLRRIPEIVSAHAGGWPLDLANRYLGTILRYNLGDRELESIELFWARCYDLGLIEHLRPMKLYGGSQF